jgi:hypothetical protein
MPPAKHREPAVPAKMKIVVEQLLSQHVYDLEPFPLFLNRGDSP